MVSMARMTNLTLFLVSAWIPSVYAQDTAGIEQMVQPCFECHGENGASTESKYPILAGQHLYYLYVQLKDFKSGLRVDREMSPEAETLSKDDMLAIAQYFSEQQWPNNRYEIDQDKARKGAVAASAGQCVQCHLGGYEGESRNPRLAGLQPEYLRKTMMDFKTKARANSPAKASLMASFSDEEIEALAEFLAGI